MRNTKPTTLFKPIQPVQFVPLAPAAAKITPSNAAARLQEMEAFRGVPEHPEGSENVDQQCFRKTIMRARAPQPSVREHSTNVTQSSETSSDSELM